MLLLSVGGCGSNSSACLHLNYTGPYMGCMSFCQPMILAVAHMFPQPFKSENLLPAAFRSLPSNKRAPVPRHDVETLLGQWYATDFSISEVYTPYAYIRPVWPLYKSHSSSSEFVCSRRRPARQPPMKSNSTRPWRQVSHPKYCALYNLIPILNSYVFGACIMTSQHHMCV